MPKPIELQTLTGAALQPHLSAVAALRVEVFRDWPYIYDGDAAYEESYLRTYAAAERAAVIFAFDGDAVIGAATCLPMADETPNIRQALTDAGLNTDRIFYFGESVLRKSYRGQGIGVKFFAAREAHARQFGSYETAAFCAVERPDQHPLKPVDFLPLHDFWHRRGFSRQAELTCQMRWRDLGEAQETVKSLTFWTKPL